ncbi:MULTISPECIES: hypothetical protein [Nostoc]|uniref:Uncharacterized protein n=1 Tax=Nostoc paludosum FACHB-159 TaxID=2692908 RepID=A0ABR8KAP1_9NOSO|nr:MULTISPECIES: hypothetical protein [Nostoc]MBD2680810.1 hypothetical protein [Nostoc sp. FACHB-857]MBD2736565.1 hypothetical protein [Nostoc paludosum FACHB-159]
MNKNSRRKSNLAVFTLLQFQSPPHHPVTWPAEAEPGTAKDKAMPQDRVKSDRCITVIMKLLLILVTSVLTLYLLLSSLKRIFWKLDYE